MVVYGEPGLDEVSPLGPTHVVEVRKGSTTRWTITPEEHGFKKIALEDLAGSEPAENARIIVTLLDGKGPSGARAATLLNAAAAIYVSGRVKTFADGVAAAKESIDSGQAKSVLDRLRRASPKPVKTGA
jgi:anthranilate phosphoribosyltransferase